MWVCTGKANAEDRIHSALVLYFHFLRRKEIKRYETHDRNILQLDVELLGPLQQVGSNPGGDLSFGEVGIDRESESQFVGFCSSTEIREDTMTREKWNSQSPSPR